MWPLAAAFVEITLHRRGPESLPASTFLFRLVLVCYVLMGLLVLVMRGAFTPLQFLIFCGDMALYLAFVFAVLRFFKHDRRFRQTVTALLGSDIVINVFSIPVAVAGQMSGAASDSGPLFWIFLGLLLWWIDVAGFVLARALNQPYIVGLMLVILYVMTSFSLQDYLTQAST